MPSPALFEYNGQRKWDEFTVFVPAVPLSQAKLQIHSVLFSIRSQARPEGRAHDSRFTLRFLVLTFPLYSSSSAYSLQITLKRLLKIIFNHCCCNLYNQLALLLLQIRRPGRNVGHI